MRIPRVLGLLCLCVFLPAALSATASLKWRRMWSTESCRLVWVESDTLACEGLCLPDNYQCDLHTEPHPTLPNSTFTECRCNHYTIGLPPYVDDYHTPNSECAESEVVRDGYGRVLVICTEYNCQTLCVPQSSQNPGPVCSCP